MRIRKNSMGAAFAAGALLVAGSAIVATSACHKHKEPVAKGPTGGPTLGPIVDIDTDGGGPVRYIFTREGVQNMCTEKKDAPLNPDWKRKVDLIRLFDSAGMQTYDPGSQIKITFEDGSYVLATDNGSYLDWTCYRADNTKEKDLAYGGDAKDFFVDSCMYKHATTFTVNGQSGNWYHVELK